MKCLGRWYPDLVDICEKFFRQQVPLKCFGRWYLVILYVTRSQDYNCPSNCFSRKNQKYHVLLFSFLLSELLILCSYCFRKMAPPPPPLCRLCKSRCASSLATGKLFGIYFQPSFRHAAVRNQMKCNKCVVLCLLIVQKSILNRNIFARVCARLFIN